MATRWVNSCVTRHSSAVAAEAALKSCVHPGHGYLALFLYISALRLSVPCRFPVHACTELGMMEGGQDYIALRNVQALMLEDCADADDLLGLSSMS